MESADRPFSGRVSAYDYLDFVFDDSGWTRFGPGEQHVCSRHAIAGHAALAAALEADGQPVRSGTFRELGDFVRQDGIRPLVFVFTSCAVADEAQSVASLSELMASLARRRKTSATVSVVLGEVIGPIAMLARLGDMICFGPKGSLALADAATAKRVASPEAAAVPSGILSRRFASDAAALLAARRIVTYLPDGPAAHTGNATGNPAEDPALERLVGSDPELHVDARRLLQRISDDGTLMEFDGSGGLIACLVRIGGQTTGVLASCATQSGALDAKALAQADTLVAFCARHSLPVVTLIDSPGVVPDSAALAALTGLVSSWENSGASVVSLVLRKAIGASAAALIPSSATVLHWPGSKAGLLRDTAASPRGSRVSIRSTRRALMDAFGAQREFRG